jgi:RNA polymerase sigma-70 factor (ECF subfamily)
MQNESTTLPGCSHAIQPGSADEDELARCAQRDPDAFAALYHRHVNGIYLFHLARTGNVDDAQDLTSQTFLAALEGIRSYRGQGSFRGWLFGIASHKVVDHYRRRRPDIPLENGEIEAWHDPAPLPEEVATTHLELAQVARALRALSLEQAEALALRLYGGLSAAEIGRLMGKSEAAVKMLVHRALRGLREEMTHHLEVQL